MIKKLIKKIIPKFLINKGIGLFNSFAVKCYTLKYKSLVVRKDTTDIEIFKSVFLFHEFKIPVKIQPKIIIDAGAYTGLSSLYFSSKYPDSKIIAIEPEESNFEILCMNTRDISNIKRIKAGLSYKDCFLKIIDSGTGEWGFRTKEVDESEVYDVRGITINSILKESGFDHIDVLKLDIEGSEKELFTENYESWLDKVNVIIIELHDRFKDGCTNAFYSATSRYKWDYHIKQRDKVILIRNNTTKTI